MHKFLEWIVVITRIVTAVAFVVLIPIGLSIKEDMEEMNSPEGFGKLISTQFPPEKMAVFWALIEPPGNNTPERPPSSEASQNNQSILQEEDLREVREDRSFRQALKGPETLVQNSTSIQEVDPLSAEERSRANISSAPPSLANETEINKTRVNTTTAKVPEKLPGPEPVESNESTVPGDQPEVQPPAPSSEEPGTGGQECPAGTPSGGLGGPPDQITGECEGVEYTCYRENTAPTLTDPAYYYGCLMSGLDGRSPPDQMGGEYQTGGGNSKIKYNCVLQPGEPTEDYPYYRYRCTLS